MKTKLILLASFAIGTAAFAQDTAPVAPPAPASATAPAGPETTAPAPSEAAAPAPTTTDTSATVADTTAPVAALEATDTANYPVCSRSVTDKCVQSHERHRARPR
jgi:hypothetical protein